MYGKKSRIKSWHVIRFQWDFSLDRTCRTSEKSLLQFSIPTELWMGRVGAFLYSVVSTTVGNKICTSCFLDHADRLRSNVNSHNHPNWLQEPKLIFALCMNLPRSGSEQQPGLKLITVLLYRLCSGWEERKVCHPTLIMLAVLVIA